MLHNQVPELIELLTQYSTTIWPYLAESNTGVPISDTILYVADYPNTNYMERLVDYQDNLKAIISITDQGIVSKRSLQFAESKKEYMMRISLEVITADPTLRDQMGGSLFEFLSYNADMIRGTESDWIITDVDSSGITAAPASLFGRTYLLWITEHS